MSAELKNCPFCGGEAKLIEGEECAYVQCLQVKCHRGPFVDGDNAAADEAVEHWNRRTDLSQASVAAALEAAAGKCDARHWTWAASMGRNPEKYMSPYAIAAKDIRALITDRDRDALAEHVAAEVSKARAEDVARIDAQMRRRTPNTTHDDTFDCGWNAGLHAALAQIGAKP